jgi:hypothetical protein
MPRSLRSLLPLNRTPQSRRTTKKQQTSIGIMGISRYADQKTQKNHFYIKSPSDQVVIFIDSALRTLEALK